MMSVVSSEALRQPANLVVKKSRVFLRSSVGSVFQQLGGVCVVVVVGVGALRLAILPCGLLGAPRSW